MTSDHCVVTVPLPFLIWMPKYQHDRVALTVACGGQRVCVLFTLGSQVKCASSFKVHNNTYLLYGA